MLLGRQSAELRSNYALYRTGQDKVASPWLKCPVDKRVR
jgi:hypothetical protein